MGKCRKALLRNLPHSSGVSEFLLQIFTYYTSYGFAFALDIASAFFCGCLAFFSDCNVDSAENTVYAEKGSLIPIPFLDSETIKTGKIKDR